MIVTQHLSASCKNLQTVLDRATDGADICVTSDTLFLNGSLIEDHLRMIIWVTCVIESHLSYTLSHLNDTSFTVVCDVDVHLDNDTVGLYYRLYDFRL